MIKKKTPIKIKPSKQGSLRKATGTKTGKNIPASKLKITSKTTPAMKKKIVFAKNAKKWNKK